MNRDIRKMLTAFLLCTISFFVAQAADVPAKPANAAATTNRTDGIRLTWNAVAGASYYIVYRYGGQTSQTGLVQTKVTTSSYLDTSCEAGANIPYRVRAFNSSGVGGAYSAYVRGYRKVLLEPYVGGNVSVNPLANGGAAQPLKVRCNVDWTARASDWINLNSSAFDRSNEASELGFSLEPNTTGEMREGTITVYAGQESATLKVLQGAVSVSGYDTWCGDSALAIIEDASLPEEFCYRTEYTGGFLSYPDETAVGGSCLRTSPLALGGRAVISWDLPNDWKLRFRWRKDTSKSADALKLYAGNFASDGTPNLSAATLIATCSSTAWAQVEVSSQAAPGADAVFFVYDKDGTSETSSGFGFIDDFLLMTAPREISFVNPPVKIKNGDYTLKLPCDKELAVAAEVTFSHTVFYGGQEREVKSVVYPQWRKVSGGSKLSYRRGAGDDANKTIFSSSSVETINTVEMEASFSLAGVTVSRPLRVEITPTAAYALDSPGLHSGDATDWDWTSDETAYNLSCVSSGTLTAGEEKSFSVVMDGICVFRFSYRLERLGADETAYFTVDGSDPIMLPATSDTEWHYARVYIADAGSHEIKWTYAKSGGAARGSGISIDNVWFEGGLPASIILNNEEQTAILGGADRLVTAGTYSMSLVKGDWLDVSPSSEPLGVKVYPLVFDADANDTSDVRSGRIRIVCGGATNLITVIQSPTDSTEVTELTIEPSQSPYHVVEGEPTAFSASFTLGGFPAVGFTDLEWSMYGFDGIATIEDGVLLVEPSESNHEGELCVQVGDLYAWQPVRAHPPFSLVIPEGLEFDIDGWWVEDGFSPAAGPMEDRLFLKTDTFGNKGTRKTMTATVQGPGLFKCEGRGSHSTDLYLDGERCGFAGGPNWSECEAVEVPEGVHELSIVYEKASYDGDFSDAGEIRKLSWTPLVFDGFILRPPEPFTSGSAGAFELFKRFTDAASGYVMEVPGQIDDIEQVEVTTTDPRTRELLTVELYRRNGVWVKVPFSVQWSDYVDCTVRAEAYGVQEYANSGVSLTPIDIAGLVDSNVAEVGIPIGPYISDEAEAVVDETAVNGTSLRLKTSSSSYWPILEMKVLGAGNLSFNYSLFDNYLDSSLVVSVDGKEVAEYTQEDNHIHWESEEIFVDGTAPHVIQFKLRPGEYRPAQAYCDIDNVFWTPTDRTITAIDGLEIEGPDSAEVEDASLWYTISATGSVRTVGGPASPETWQVVPDEFVLQFVSGDPDALHVDSVNEWCVIAVSEVVSEPSVFTVVARYTIDGYTHEASRTVTVPQRTSVRSAIFDADFYKNCMIYWNAGWNGVFDEHSAGISCARSRTLDVGEEAELTVSMWGSGTLEFDWKVSCANADALEFRKEFGDEEPHVSITGTGGGWQHVVVEYEGDRDEYGMPLMRICHWRFVKNTSARGGLNCGWIDNITWTGLTKRPIEYTEMSVKSPLVPGETVPVEITFYRNEAEEGEEFFPVDDSDPDLPTSFELSFSEFSDPMLEQYVSSGVDDAGTPTVIIDPLCDVSGYFWVEAKYTLYGGEDSSWAYVTIDASASPPVLLLASRGVSGGRSLMSMAANGLNTVGECLEAGLDPDDADAKFTMFVTMSKGVPHITWSPNLPGRTYIIKGKTSLADPQWVDVGKVPQGDTEWVAPANSTYRFFKVEIESNK